VFDKIVQKLLISAPLIYTCPPVM